MKIMSLKSDPKEDADELDLPRANARLRLHFLILVLVFALFFWDVGC